MSELIHLPGVEPAGQPAPSPDAALPEGPVPVVLLALDQGRFDAARSLD